MNDHDFDTLLAEKTVEKEDIFEGNEELKSKFIIQKQSRYSISYITVLRPNGEVL
mgnify:CR=1 FL=1